MEMLCPDIFELPESECINSIPEDYECFHELPVSERNMPNYKERVLNSLRDNNVAEEHFITSLFLESYRSELTKWFKIPKDVKQFISDKLFGVGGEVSIRDL